MDISSISLTSVLASSLVEVVVIDHVADVVGADVGSAVAIGVVGANVAAKVEGIVVVSVGMIVASELSILACLSWIKLSNVFSISFNWSYICSTKSIIPHDWSGFLGLLFSVGGANETT